LILVWIPEIHNFIYVTYGDKFEKTDKHCCLNVLQ